MKSPRTFSIGKLTVPVLAASYSHILAPATAYGKNILPRVAARLDDSVMSRKRADRRETETVQITGVWLGALASRRSGDGGGMFQLCLTVAFQCSSMQHGLKQIYRSFQHPINFICCHVIL